MNVTTRPLPWPLSVLSLVCVLPLAACDVSLTAPEGVKIACAGPDDCPSGYTCTGGVCEPNNGNAPPTVSFGSIAPSKGVVVLPLVVSDPEGDVVQLRAMLGRGESAVDLDLTAEVPATAVGAPFDLEWDAAAFFGSTARVSDLVITVIPRDRYHAGAAVASPGFTFGNNPPVIASLSVATDNGVASGQVAVSFTIIDDIDDDLRLSRFALSSATANVDVDVALDASSFPEGSLDGIAASPSGTAHTIIWDTGADAAWALADAKIEIEVEDELGDRSSPFESSLFSIDNAPSVAATLTAPAGAVRRLSTVEGEVSVSDPNDDLVDLVAEYRVASGPWRPASLSLAGESLSGITADGLPHAFAWDALADAASDLDLESAAVVSSASGTVSAVVSFTPAVELRLAAQDATGLPSAPLVLGPFALGDDAPAVTFGAIGESKLDVAIPLELSDSSADTVELELEFCPPDLAPCDPDAAPVTAGWRATAIAFGTISGVATGSSVQHMVRWAAATARNDAQPAAPQGLGGESAEAVTLRARAHDRVDTTTSVYGDWAFTTTGRVIIQTAPTIPEVTLQRLGLEGGVAPLAIDYTLVDNQGDLADLQCDFSQDLGVTWQRCREYLDPRSEGRYDLATAPLDLQGSGGVRHRFVWDPSGQFEAAPTTFLRLTVRDDSGESAKTLTLPKAVAPLTYSPQHDDTSGPFGAEHDLGNEGVGPGGLQLRGLVTGDFNEDGEPDVAAAFDDGTIWWFLGQRVDGVRQGRFDAGASYNVGGRPVDLVTGDFNCDGHLDLATVDAYASEAPAKVLLGDGASHFTLKTETDYSRLTAPLALGVGDFNEDGCDDLVIVHRHPYASLSVTMKGSAQVFFSTHDYWIDGDATLMDVAVGDINNDGILDVVVVSSSNTMFVILGAGSAGLGDGQLVSTPWRSHALPLGGPNAVAAGDVDFDGAAEVLVGSSMGVTFFANDGTGSLTATQLLLDRQSFQVAIADLNGDGAPDLLVPNVFVPTVGPSSSWLHVFFGDALGGFAPPFIWPEASDGRRQITDLAVAQVGGDRAPDLLYGAMDADELFQQIRRDIGAFRGSFDADSNYHDWSEAVFAQKEGDNVSTAIPQPNVSLPIDIDADGALDLVVGGGDASPEASHRGLAILRGYGTGPSQPPFVPVSIVPTAFIPIALASGDFNGDGNADVVAIGVPVEGGAVAQVFLASPAGADPAIVAAATLAIPSSPAAVTVADLNADHTADILTANADATLSLFVGNGDGTFKTPATLATLANDGSLATALELPAYIPRGLAVCDLNTDGRPDLLVTAYDHTSNVGGISVRLAAATPGSYPTRADHVISVEGGPFDPLALVCADYDDDGIPDVVTVGLVQGMNVESTGVVLFGQGSGGAGTGTLGDQVAFPLYVPGYSATLRYAYSLAAGDFNGDGHLDLATGSTRFGVYVHRGTGARGAPFGAAPTYYTTQYEPYSYGGRESVAAADVDDDGLLDIVITDGVMGSVRLLGSHRPDREPWTRQLVAWPRLDATLPSYTPASLADGGTDRFAKRRGTPTISQHPSVLTPDGRADFTAALRAALPSDAARGLPLTRPWRVSGDRHLVRVAHPELVGAAGPRLQMVSTLGPRTAPGSHVDFDRQGLSLAAGSFASQRGLIVTLPVESRWTNSDISSGEVRVFQASTEFVRADEVLADPFHAHEGAHRFLPRVSDGSGGFRDVVSKRVGWRRIPPDADGDFEQGAESGPRFVVVLTAAGERQVQVLTDSLGTFQALLIP